MIGMAIAMVMTNDVRRVTLALLRYFDLLNISFCFAHSNMNQQNKMKLNDCLFHFISLFKKFSLILSLFIACTIVFQM